MENSGNDNTDYGDNLFLYAFTAIIYIFQQQKIIYYFITYFSFTVSFDYLLLFIL